VRRRGVAHAVALEFSVIAPISGNSPNPSVKDRCGRHAARRRREKPRGLLRRSRSPRAPISTPSARHRSAGRRADDSVCAPRRSFPPACTGRYGRRATSGSEAAASVRRLSVAVRASATRRGATESGELRSRFAERVRRRVRLQIRRAEKFRFSIARITSPIQGRSYKMRLHGRKRRRSGGKAKQEIRDRYKYLPVLRPTELIKEFTETADARAIGTLAQKILSLQRTITSPRNRSPTRRDDREKSRGEKAEGDVFRTDGSLATLERAETVTHVTDAHPTLHVHFGLDRPASSRAQAHRRPRWSGRTRGTGVG